MKPVYIERASAVSPLGSSLDDIWQNIIDGNTVHSTISLANGQSYLVAECEPGTRENLSDYGSLFSQKIISLVSELKLTTSVDVIFFASAVGNLAEAEHQVYSCNTISSELLDFAATENVFRKTAAWGEHTRFVTIPTGCCAGLQAMGLARALMHQLNVTRGLVMSLDFGLTPLAIESFNKINATRSYSDSLSANPSRPFCTDRDGFLFADGGGAVLITTNRPEGDGVAVTGYGCVSSAFHMTDIETDGRAIRQSIEKALTDADISAEAITHINLHASGTQQNDLAEYQALLDVIGHDIPPVTAFKGNHGHALGGANMIEVALTWKMMMTGILPPTPYGLPVNAYPQITARHAPINSDFNAVLKTASGFSGIHAALILELVNG
ncbi:beta-ketoacyl synthase N-terminal-like domain-containing protein [Mixta intestinalis]|uniref:Actinorhodin polyketide putative beta-ketoacyl synthase 1 n=1 Tax=Mixta intestinalis TaxID=1615494 RepID=A0A6P1Q6G2_9GAMM|nr:beta-ketoacyl synthase N-terminal-like domain-containing protein [Mixta intestinalis]QHM74002.1 Actinorhodin polyketide putative beta-ketoacyl synthase 1 [Mixta intestinalis]